MPTVGIPVPLTDTANYLVVWQVTDTCVVEVITAISLTPIPASETLSLGLTDSAHAPAVAFSVSDSSTINISDSLPGLMFGTHISDSILLGWLEPSGGQFDFLTSESVQTVAVEGAPLIASNFVFTATDMNAVQASESTPTFPLNQAVLASESITGGLTEGGQLINAVTFASETLGISANEAASLLLKFILITDSLGIPADEASSLFSNFIQLPSVSDGNVVQAVESINFLQTLLTQLSTTESLKVQASEGSTFISGTATFSDVILTDLQEFVSAALSFATTDSAAYRIASEDANIIHSGVLFVTVFASDDSAIQVTDVSPSQVWNHLASDGCAVPFSEIASAFKDVPLQEVWDGGDDIDYTRCEPDPVSYRTMEKSLW